MKALITLCFTLVSFLSFGQAVEMADLMRSEGKIYVVVAILVVILTGFVILLLNTDRKVKNLEEKIKNK